MADFNTDDRIKNAIISYFRKNCSGTIEIGTIMDDYFFIRCNNEQFKISVKSRTDPESIVEDTQGLIKKEMLID